MMEVHGAVVSQLMLLPIAKACEVCVTKHAVRYVNIIHHSLSMKKAATLHPNLNIQAGNSGGRQS